MKGKYLLNKITWQCHPVRSCNEILTLSFCTASTARDDREAIEMTSVKIKLDFFVSICYNPLI